MIQIDVGREVCKLFAQNYSLRGLDFQNKSLRVTEENIVARNEFLKLFLGLKGKCQSSSRLNSIIFVVFYLTLYTLTSVCIFSILFSKMQT